MGRLLLRLLLNSVLFINAIAIVSNFANKDDVPIGFRLPDHVIPEHYNIQLDLTVRHLNKERSFILSNIIYMYGACDIHIEITCPTWYISLHAKQPQIEILGTALTSLESSTLYKYPTNTTYNNETHILVFHFDSKLSTGHYILKINFVSIGDDDRSFLKMAFAKSNKNEPLFIPTPITARQLFPCWDEPALKATFKIFIKYNAKYQILSNMLLKDIIEDDEDVLLTNSKTTTLMSTYLVLFVIYDMFPYNSTFKQQYDEKIMLANYITDTITSPFASVNNRKYLENISDTYQVTNSDSRYKSMKVPLYRKATILNKDILVPVMYKIDVIRTIGYELIYQWFENLISPSWWSDYWLHEGIATLLGTNVINKGREEHRMLDLFVVQIQHESLRLDNFTEGVMKPLTSEINKTSEIDSLFSFSFYIKAPVILRMLQQFLSDRVFQKGIAIFLSKHKFSSASIDDFWDAMQTAHDMTNIEIINITEIMNAWTKQKHYPVLNVTQMHDYIIVQYIRITVENIKNVTKIRWQIPVIITTQANPNFSIDFSKIYHNWRESNSVQFMDIAVDCKNDEWIIVNLQQIGYYRVNYDLKNWQNIAKYLNSADYMKIHVLNRAQIIDDAYYFLSTGQLDMYTFLKLTRYLSQERDFVAWYPMIKALEDMSSTLPVSNTEEQDLFKETMKEILNGVLERIGYEEYNYEEDALIQCLRQEVAKWACILKESKCIIMAKNKLEQHLIHSKRILPWWKHWTYCNGVTTEEGLNGTWSMILEEWMSTSDHKLLEFLTCVAHPNPMKEYLNVENLTVYLDLKETDFSQKNISVNFRDLDRVKRFLFMIMRHAKNDEILEYILENFEKVKPREIHMVTALVIIINHVYSHAQLQKITQFVENFTKQKIFITNRLEGVFLHNQLNKIHELARISTSELISLIHCKIQKRLLQIKLIQNRIREKL